MSDDSLLWFITKPTTFYQLKTVFVLKLPTFQEKFVLFAKNYIRLILDIEHKYFPHQYAHIHSNHYTEDSVRSI